MLFNRPSNCVINSGFYFSLRKAAFFNNGEAGKDGKSVRSSRIFEKVKHRKPQPDKTKQKRKIGDLIARHLVLATIREKIACRFSLVAGLYP
jgi:hypothetical protein